MTDLPTYHATVDELDRKIHRLARSINAQNYEMLVLIGEFDERCGWLKWGSTSCAQWLHWRCDLSLTTAHEKVRMARALKGLPLISQAFSTGALSYSKVRALTRVGTPDNEAPLLEYALSVSAARVEERCRQLRQGRSVSVKEARTAHQARGLSISRQDERGMMTVVAQVPAEMGLLLTQALDKAIERDVADGPELSQSSWRALQADALVALAKHYLAGGSGAAASADQYQVVVHVDEAALGGNDTAQCRADLPIESVRRLTCDGALIPMLSAKDGEPLNVGRKQRTIPTALKRALWARDKGCAFPGCSHKRFVDAHHIRHWSRGGETSLENTKLLCSSHHRLVHEGGYIIEKDLSGGHYFKRPDGRAVPQLGYRYEDVVDEGVGGESSAEDELVKRRPLSTLIRESPALYRHGSARDGIKFADRPQSRWHGDPCNIA